MHTETITYTDYNGVERTEDFRFNLTKTEAFEMEMSTAGGLSEKIKEITATNDYPTLIKLFKNIVLKSYGVKSDDGRRFIKSDTISSEFEQNPAFSIIYMKLATDDKAAAKFINGILPSELTQKSSPAPKK